MATMPRPRGIPEADPMVRAFLDGRPDLRPATRNAYEKDLSRLVVFARARAKSLASLTLHDLRQFLAAEADRYSARTAARTLTAIRQCYRVLLEKGLVPANPAELCLPPPQRPRRPRTLTREEWSALEAWLSSPSSPGEGLARLAVRLCMETGARGREVLRLVAGDFRERGARVTVGRGPSRRTIPLSPALAALVLSTVGGTEPRQRVFVDRLRRPLGGAGIRRLFERARRGAGLDRRPTPTLVRHTVAARWLADGQDVAFVRKLLGLARLPSVEPYVFETSEEELRHLVRTLHPRA
jgi:integrase/recombinase XerD